MRGCRLSRKSQTENLSKHKVSDGIRLPNSGVAHPFVFSLFFPLMDKGFCQSPALNITFKAPIIRGLHPYEVHDKLVEL